MARLQEQEEWTYKPSYERRVGCFPKPSMTTSPAIVAYAPFPSSAALVQEHFKGLEMIDIRRFLYRISPFKRYLRTSHENLCGSSQIHAGPRNLKFFYLFRHS